MRIDVLTLFPEMFAGVLGSSILRRAAEASVVAYHLHDIRAHTTDKHAKVDAAPFGGGPGMVLQCQPVWDAVTHVEAQDAAVLPTRIVLTPTGEPLTQVLAERLARRKRLLLIAGHYEGFDQRVLDRLHAAPVSPEAAGDEDGLIELSIGDYVLSGGELPAMVLIDAVVRLLPGALGDEGSAHHDSFSGGTSRLLDCPHYTRPRVWDGREVPPVLLGGDHGKIEAWRAARSRELTAARRPDLMGGAGGRAMTVVIRDAEAGDANAIAELHREGFGRDAEAELVRELDRAGHAMISLVAEQAGRVVGHVLLSEMAHAEAMGMRGLLGLGPIAVETGMRGKGIGSALVREAIRQSRAARVRVIFVLGDPGWYSRLGFKSASTWGWHSVYPDAGDAFAALPLRDAHPPPGLVRYAPPFDAIAD